MSRTIAGRLARPLLAERQVTARLCTRALVSLTGRRCAHTAQSIEHQAQDDLDDFFAGHADTSAESSRDAQRREEDGSRTTARYDAEWDQSIPPARQDPSTPERHTVSMESIGDLSSFLGDTSLAAFSPPDHTSHPSSSPLTPPLKTNDPRPLAEYIVPAESGVEMIQGYLAQHPFLTNQEIWKLGTDGMVAPLPLAHVIGPDGRIKMKRVSTMREGRRPWVPPHEARFPEHPFKSLRFLKRTILVGLEDLGIIHRATKHVPLETEEEIQEAVSQAERRFKKAERRAMRLQVEVPTPREPILTREVHGWALGPRPEYEVDSETNQRLRVYPAGERGDGTWGDEKLVLTPGEQYNVPESKWAVAKRLERDYHRGKYIDAVQTAERQKVRRARYREEKVTARQQREEDIKLGRQEEMYKEKRRLQALEDVRRYAEQTGEDVSGWFEELQQPLGYVAPYRPQHLAKGGAIPWGKNPRSKMRPVGYPIK